ncbi:MAG: hypothetical protein ATN35_03205 [Epulopiscium sp. Nele67-Bin004]|nr:MAG: hypothetical protein ATN35_03205 [Epulopiscium sp. Nele67-Bin004]
MKEKTSFCNECNHEVVVAGASSTLQGKLKGQTYFYEGEVPLSDCGHEVKDDEIEMLNLKALHDTYRAENNIISLEKIREIPTKYQIGKRPLSNLLEWGELTFTRYFEGDLPSKAYSKILDDIYNSPEIYLEILEKNKNNISIKTYQKSIAVAKKLLQQNSKANDILSYIICNTADITQLSAQKLLYYCEGFYIAFFDTPLFNDSCYAHESGPIYQGLCISNIENINLLPAEKVVIDNVIKSFACYSGMTLASMTTAEMPWILSNEQSKCISKQDIKSYFVEVVKKYNMLSALDIQVYAKKMFDMI